MSTRPVGATRLGLLPPYLFAEIERKIAAKKANLSAQSSCRKPAKRPFGGVPAGVAVSVMLIAQYRMRGSSSA